MSRLFRGERLDSDEREYVFGYYYVIKGAMPNSSDRHVIVTEGEAFGASTLHIPVKEGSAAQYTGKDDISQTKIFEGDNIESAEVDGIVKYSDDFASYVVEYLDCKGRPFIMALVDCMEEIKVVNKAGGACESIL